MTIIAEIGQNHCGLMDLATDLIRLAKENGADLAKLQLYSHEALYKDHHEIPNVELSFEQARGLFNYGKEIGIEVFFSVFDVERVKWCEEIGVKRYKIGSLRKTSELLKAVAQTGKLVVISIPPEHNFWFEKCQEIFDFVIPDYNRVNLLYCIPEYPAKLDRLQLLCKDVPGGERWSGYSDHSVGIDVCKYWMARYGVSQVIEKHFAIDHETGIDAKWSMTPSELAELKRWETVCKQVL